MTSRFSNATEALDVLASVVPRAVGNKDGVVPTVLVSEGDYNLFLPGGVGDADFVPIHSIQRYVYLECASSIGMHPEGTLILGHSCGLKGFGVRCVTRLEANEGVVPFTELKGKLLSPVLEFGKWMKRRKNQISHINYSNYSVLDFPDPNHEFEFRLRWL